MRKILAMIWRKCGDADLRALLGHGGGHNVVAFGSPDLWHDNLGLEINSEQQGGTDIAIQPEPEQVSEFVLPTYRHEGRNEVRLKVPPILEVAAQPSRVANENAEFLDPDGETKSDDLIVFLIMTGDRKFHLRACLASSLVAPISDWVSAHPTSGRKFTGAALGPWEGRVWETLIRHKNVLLFGPPGTGKTWVMLRIRDAFENGVDEIVFEPHDLENPFHVTATFNSMPGNRRAEFVTFHQSLTYESFVVGLHPKPIDSKGGGGLTFSPRDGIFLSLAEYALKEDSAALLLIDELNRGNVADILGELITVLEDDKRLAPDRSVRSTTVTVTLPLKPERLDQKFRMPSAFYLLASMNSLDRSVAPLDSALRRRFRLLSVAPDLDVARNLMLCGRVECELENPDRPSPDECKSLALALLRRLNDGIRTLLGPEFQIGQSYIIQVAEYGTLVDAIADTVLPQLYELFRDRPRDLVELLGEDIVTLSEEATEVGLGVSGSVPANLIDVRQLEPGTLMRRLYAVAHGRPWSSQIAPAEPEVET